MLKRNLINIKTVYTQVKF